MHLTGRIAAERNIRQSEYEVIERNLYNAGF
jgi:hypothetical protein